MARPKLGGEFIRAAAPGHLVVMDNGLIVEQGSHRELLQTGGLYSQLWERQSGGFLGMEAEAVPVKGRPQSDAVMPPST